MPPRDLKPKKSQPDKQKARGGTLIGMFIGLVLGVAVAAGVVWYMNRAPMPFVTKSVPAPAKPESGKPDPAPANGSGDKAAHAQSGQPLPLPGKPGDPVPEKRFQFYDILPGKADAMPEPKAPAEEAKKDVAKKDESKEVKKDETRKDEGKKEEAKKDDTRQTLFLQAGSFTKPTEADNLKASLALMGVEASVQQVMVQDKTFYRVRLGPYNRIDEVNKVRSDLAKAGIDASLVKKEP